MRKVVYCSFSLDGTHNWKDCPIEEVSYLKYEHRHMFGFKCYVVVSHNDRDVEFIELKHKIVDYLTHKYFDPCYKTLRFGGMSCEMIAEELIDQFDLDQCEVNEDNENGSILTKETYYGKF